MCGGTDHVPYAIHQEEGLSPRVRGNLSSVVRWRVVQRSIPACAGEPPDPGSALTQQTVYPRVCGGTRPHCAAGTADRRSIPACAGEPNDYKPVALAGTVYPRVCGGTRNCGIGTRG